MNELQATGIAELDRMIGGIPRGSRNMIVGPPGTGKTVFAMQFLWTGLERGETVAYDVFDRPWTHMRRYFLSLGWGVEPYEREGKLLPIQAFPHYDEYERDPLVEYFDLADFDEMKRIDLDLSRKEVARFVAGDFTQHVFTTLTESQWQKIEEWTVSWAHHDDLTNLDIMSEGTDCDAVTTRMKDFTAMLAHNIFRFRAREVGDHVRRELRIEKIEGVAHPLDWLPFEIGTKGISLLGNAGA